jgi:hypothetical protein
MPIASPQALVRNVIAIDGENGRHGADVFLLGIWLT